MVRPQKSEFPDFEDVCAPFGILLTGWVSIGMELLNAGYEVWETILGPLKQKMGKTS